MCKPFSCRSHQSLLTPKIVQIQKVSPWWDQEIPGHYHTVQTRELQVASSSWEQQNIASRTKGPQIASYIPGDTWSIRLKIQ